MKKRKIIRDEQGRFAKKKIISPKRDKLGRFISKKAVKKVVLKKKVLIKTPSKKQVVSKFVKPTKKALPKKIEKKPSKQKPVQKKKVVPKKSVKVLKPSKRKPAKTAKPKKIKKTSPIKPSRKAPAKPSRKKPKKPVLKKLGKKPTKPKAPTKPSRKKPKKPSKLVGKKPAKPAKPIKRKRKKKKPELPLVPKRSEEAERVIQGKLISLQSLIDMLEGGLNMGIKTFINVDGTVDGELRVSNLPEEWRTTEGLRGMIATLSNAFGNFIPFDKSPREGGGYWISFGVRFGAQNEADMEEMADMYKRHRGLFQIGTYPTQAWNNGPIQILLTGDTVGLMAMVRNLLSKRGLPPSVLLVRFIWTPDGSRPGHYQGERGERNES